MLERPLKMLEDHVQPNSYTFVALLKACTRLTDLEKGQNLYASICVRGLEIDLFIGNTLLDMYAKCGSLLDALGVFVRLPVRDLVSWNAIIAGYSEHTPTNQDEATSGNLNCSQLQQSLQFYKEMQENHVQPDSFTYVAVLKACIGLKDTEKGQGIHSEILKKGFERDFYTSSTSVEDIIGNTLVDMYGKCGLLADALLVFDNLLAREEVSWTALITGYTEYGHGERALSCFERMQMDGISPDSVAFRCGLKACGFIGALETGWQMHGEIIVKGFERDQSVGNTLVDMYCKCGAIKEGWEVFHKLPARNVVSWTSIINGFGENHKGSMAVQCFEDMQKMGVKPNAITFTCLLAACSHASLVNEGQEYFKLMKDQFEIQPTQDHYGCMVDLLARSGYVYEANWCAKAIHGPPSEDVLKALLTACKIHGEIVLGLKCFQQLVKINKEDAAAYLLLADVYASMSRWTIVGIDELRDHARGKARFAVFSVEAARELHEVVMGHSTYEKHSWKFKSLQEGEHFMSSHALGAYAR